MLVYKLIPNITRSASSKALRFSVLLLILYKYSFIFSPTTGIFDSPSIIFPFSFSAIRITFSLVVWKYLSFYIKQFSRLSTALISPVSSFMAIIKDFPMMSSKNYLLNLYWNTLLLRVLHRSMLPLHS